MTVPAQPKIYHIVHVDRLPSIIASAALWCDAEIARNPTPGTTIGMSNIKKRRLSELTLSCYPGLYVGECVPFYFCPRSVMLYKFFMGNDAELTYTGGQAPIIHLEADLQASVAWAITNNKRWAFTLSNAGSYYFEARCDIAQLGEVNWDAVQANRWGGRGIPASVQEGKQAEFLLEHSFPWHLVERIGVYSMTYYNQATHALTTSDHTPLLEIIRDWYY